MKRAQQLTRYGLAALAAALALLAPVLVLGAVRNTAWKRLGPVRQQQSGLRWLMDSRPVVAAGELVGGRPTFAIRFLFTGSFDDPSATRVADTNNVPRDKPGEDGEPDVDDPSGGYYSALIETVEASARGELGPPAAAPLAAEYLRVIRRLDERARNERGRGFLGLAYRYDLARATSLGRRWASALAGVDLTGFGWSDAAALGVAALNFASATRGAGAAEEGAGAGAGGDADLIDL